MKTKPFLHLLSAAFYLGAAAGAQAAFPRGVDTAWTTDTTETDDYWFADPAVTWEANDGAVVTFGDNTANAGRLFVGMDHNSFAQSDGTLVLTSTSGAPGTFELLGFHGADQIVGRLGHAGGGPNHVGTLTIEGGVSVIMGSHLMKYEGSAGNTIHITNGLLDYTTAGFGFRESAGNSAVVHVIGAGGSLIVPGVFSDEAGFDAWTVAAGNGVESGDITLAVPTQWHRLAFADDGVNTTVTVVFPDDDNDGLPNGWEENYGLDPNDGGSVDPNNGADGNPDAGGGDTLTNIEEFNRGTNPVDADTDGDGWLDQVETNTGTYINPGDTGTDPAMADTDDDGLDDPDEITSSTDPFDPDSDADTLPDGWEVTHLLDPNDDGTANIDNGRDGDPDNDLLYNDEEFAGGTDPRDDDTDDDGLRDGDEVIRGTDPTKADTDEDGFWDGAETNDFSFDSYDYGTNTGDTGTDPLLPDSDGDGLLDGVEDGSGTYTSPARTGTDPNVADFDADGMDDGYEVAHMLDPTDDGTNDPANGPDGDPDTDGITNIAEHDRGSDPRSDTGSFGSAEFDTIAYAVDNTDLLQTSLGSIAAASEWTTDNEGGDPVTAAALLANGTYEDATGGGASPNGFPGETGDWIEFHLDTTANTGGYDITRIDTFAKWQDRRSRQAYAVEVRPVGGNWTVLAPSTTWTAGMAVNGTYTKVSHLGNGAVGSPLATGVEAIRFQFEDIEVEDVAWAEYREIDIIGTAAPVAGNLTLEVLGFGISQPGAFDMQAGGLDPMKNYILRSAGSLSGGSWTDVGTPFTPASASQTVSDPSPEAPRKFYRLEESP